MMLLDPRSFALVKIAALVAMDAPQVNVPRVTAAPQQIMAAPG